MSGGTGKGAFDVPEQLALEQVLRQRRAVDGHERPVAARALIVDGARDQLLAGSALAEEQHRGVGGGHRRDEAEDVTNARRLADDAAQMAGACQLALELAGMSAQAAMRNRSLDGEQEQVGHGKGLLDIIVGPEPHGIYRRLHGGVAGHDDHRQLQRALAELCQQAQAVQIAGHDQVGEHDIEAIAATLDQLRQRRVTRLEAEDVVARVAEDA